MAFKRVKVKVGTDNAIDNAYNTAYKFRLYPDKQQREFISKAVGCVRFIYNYMLYHSDENYRVYGYKWNYIAYQNILPMVKDEFPFLKEVPSQVLQKAVRDLDTAFANYFAGRASYPVFKRKRNGGKFYLPQGFSLNGNKLYIPKLKSGIKIKEHRKINGVIKSITIEKAPSGKFYVSVLAQTEKPKPLPKTNCVCGIDVGILSLAAITKDDGKTKERIKIDNPKHIAKSAKKLARLQRQLSHKQHPTAQNKTIKASNNFKKHSKKTACLHEKIANQRADYLNKLSKAIIDENQVIAVEDLNIKGMIKNHHLAKSIADVSWSMFINMLKYKAEKAGRTLIKADRFYASSKTCSICGYKKTDLTLADRQWDCPACKTHHDRDFNSSDNLCNIAHIYYLKHYLGQELPEVTPVETGSVDDRKTYVCLKSTPSLKQEAFAVVYG